jgi:hypothetical protein
METWLETLLPHMVGSYDIQVTACDSLNGCSSFTSPAAVQAGEDSTDKTKLLAKAQNDQDLIAFGCMVFDPEAQWT